MNIINTILGTPLAFIIDAAYRLTGSYGIAIIVFAIIVRIILFPLIAVAHNNSIRFLRVQPELQRLKLNYAGDKEKLGEEQYQLFKRAKYSPLMGIIPILLQLIIIVGVMQVLLNPPAVDLTFLGLELDAVPSLVNPSTALLVPVLSGIAATAFCLVQNAISPAMLTQSKKTNLGMTLFIIALSVYFGLMLPVGVGIYWTVGNLLGIVVVVLLDFLFNPKKLAPEAIAYIDANRKTPEELRKEKTERKRLRAREKQDIVRFRAAKKELVFYALTGGQYKYYKNIIEYLLGNADIKIHYLTNDPNDSLFKQENANLIMYYASQQKTISLMLNLDADVLATTVPDLQSYHMKRSIKRDDIEYIYIQHTVASVHLTLREKSLDYFDTILCVGPHQVSELRRREEMTKLPQRKLIKAGYGVYDQLLESYKTISNIVNARPKILIAPSWQADNILDLCIDDMLESLIGNGYNIIVRPHPQYVRLYPERMDALVERYSNHKLQNAENDGGRVRREVGEVEFELDFAGNQSIFTSDLLITDWSNIAFEFSYTTLKPSVFVNTPMKVMNPNYEQYNLEVVDISLRDKVGISVDIDEMKNFDVTVKKLLAEKNEYKERINQVVEQYLYHPGRNGEAGGKYIEAQIIKNK